MKIKRYSLKPKVLITAGPTREYLDPVRFLSNSSSGKMGYSLAGVALRDNSDVIVISGPVNIKTPKSLKPIFVETARQMLKQVKKYLKKTDIFISAAAVCDFRLRKPARHKIKKDGGGLALKLLPNADILTYVSENIPERSARVVAGFALETKSLVKNALKKLRLKKADLIVANMHTCIGDEYGGGYIITASGKNRIKIQKIARTKKERFAGIIWKNIKKLYEKKVCA